MGNNVAPSFLDVLEMNLYYKCSEHCNAKGADCKNGGYRHPRNCSTCICPDGFGSFDCTKRAISVFGAPPNCGATIKANNSDFQILNGEVSSSVENGMAPRHAQCWWHIRAPNGKRIQIRVKSVSGACSDGCFYGGTEIKARDFLRVGARICCRSDVRPLGILYSNTELAIISVFSQYKKQHFSIEYKIVDQLNVPPDGFDEYDNINWKDLNKENKIEEKKENKTEKVVHQVCRDIATKCFSLLNLCENRLYKRLMTSQCAKSCSVCNSSGEVFDGKNNEKEEKKKENCGKKDHDGQVFNFNF
uniref:CUB domain-containing protein n=1 Tax=Meloidogyne hapla TaxID=6305 RepID=A0A1I8BCX1_MELHA